MKLAGLLQRGLTGAGHAVDAEYDGEAGEAAALRGSYEVVVLDVMLPKKNGSADRSRVRTESLRFGCTRRRNNADGRARRRGSLTEMGYPMVTMTGPAL